jgi:hypothetical protein
VIAPAAGLAFAIALFINEGIAAAVIFLVLASLFLVRHRTLKHPIYGRRAIANSAANARVVLNSRQSEPGLGHPPCDPGYEAGQSRTRSMARRSQGSSACASTRSPRPAGEGKAAPLVTIRGPPEYSRVALLPPTGNALCAALPGTAMSAELILGHRISDWLTCAADDHVMNSPGALRPTGSHNQHEESARTMVLPFIVLLLALLAAACIAGWGVDSRDSRSNLGPLTRDPAQAPPRSEAPASNGLWG